ncbi:transmembrane and death domain protein 1 isoform X2 [Festucalex cinctus]
MQVWKCCFLLLFARTLALEEDEEDDHDEHEADTVAEDVGAHQLERLVELLSPTECEDLLDTLSQTEEELITRLENQDSDKKSIVKRHASLEETEGKCRKDLTDWFQKNGAKIYYDRLTRSLRRINRADIAIELGKNVNQDKLLNLKRYAEGYHDYIKSLNIEEAEPETDQTKRQKRGPLRCDSPCISNHSSFCSICMDHRKVDHHTFRTPFVFR